MVEGFCAALASERYKRVVLDVINKCIEELLRGWFANLSFGVGDDIFDRRAIKDFLPIVDPQEPSRRSDGSRGREREAHA